MSKYVNLLGAMKLKFVRSSIMEGSKSINKSVNFCKTDKHDAFKLAYHGDKMQLTANYLYQQESETLKRYQQRREDLVLMLGNKKKRLHHSIEGIDKKSIDDHIEFLQKEITEIDKMLNEIVDGSKELKEKTKILESIPGIGKCLASKLISFLPELGNKEYSSNELAAIVGIAPYARDSGNKKGRRGISSIPGTWKEAYDVGLRDYMLQVYNYMAMALALTGVLAFATLYFEPLTKLMFAVTPNGQIVGNTGFGTLVMFAPVGIALYFFMGFGTMKIETAKVLFWVYAALTGMSLASLGLVYTVNFCKTDKHDAFKLAYYGDKMQLTANYLYQQESETLKRYQQRREDLVLMLGNKKKRLHHSIEGIDKKSIDDHIEFLQKEITEIDKKLNEIVDGSKELKEKTKILESIPGIGKCLASKLISFLPELGNKEYSSNELAAIVGIAPYARDSDKR
ncbi:hypothetical protein Bhyg_00186 [Pseudolycoriella hygida]|uniref:Transposase IS116/IS110/IS902 C-terminal domain-containing protein n=1 Tax=Pseudolycoriella hygida TaxID=35572 RepID=A0A9Q0N975_9DIPT|nr:hypothetical protein Bhyg_00186 [Pseudolycoriella hygida]